MQVRRTLGTLAILGLGGILGGGLVVAMSGRGAAEAAAGRGGENAVSQASTTAAGRADPRVEERPRLGLDLGEGGRGRLAQRLVEPVPCRGDGAWRPAARSMTWA